MDLQVVLIGLCVGLAGGLFGKGGAAVATPLLHAAGVPAVVALAAPLPASIPATAAGALAYWRAGALDLALVGRAAAFGVPATLAGAFATRWVDADALVLLTDVLLIGLGLRLALARLGAAPGDADLPVRPGALAAVAIGTGAVAGLLATGGGVLLAPLLITVVRVPVRQAMAASLAVACALAVPGTVVHASLGHIDWTVAATLAAASVPASFVGARLALGIDARRLVRAYGAALAIMGVALAASA